MSTWLAASTGILVSCDTSTGSSFTPRRLAYSLESSQAGPDQCSPPPVVFSTSQGALASTATRTTPAFLIASMRGLLPGAGTSCANAGNAAAVASARAETSAFSRFMIVLPLFVFDQRPAHAKRGEVFTCGRHVVSKRRVVGDRRRHHVVKCEYCVAQRAGCGGPPRRCEQRFLLRVFDGEQRAVVGASFEKAKPGGDGKRDMRRG